MERKTMTKGNNSNTNRHHNTKPCRALAQWGASGTGWHLLALVGTDWHWLAVVGSGWQWLAFVGTGWHWLAVVGVDWHWLVLLGSGWHWLALVCTGWQRLALVSINWYWLALIGTGWQWWGGQRGGLEPHSVGAGAASTATAQRSSGDLFISEVEAKSTLIFQCILRAPIVFLALRG